MNDRIRQLEAFHLDNCPKRVNLNKPLLLTHIKNGGITGCSAAEKDNSVNFSCSDLSVNQLYSRYEVFDVAKYGGGITLEEAAKQRVGTSVTVEKEQFQIRDFVISSPSYKLKCYGLPKEGEAPVNRWSNFYGFGLDRSSIEVLEVFDKGDAPDEPSIKFEVLNGQLWEMYDGWLYKMKPST